VTPSSPVDFTQLVSEHEILGEDEEETLQLRRLLSDARHFVGEFPWCESVREAFLGFGIDGLVGVVLVRIQPGSDGIDEWLWIVVGDLPPSCVSGWLRRKCSPSLRRFSEANSMRTPLGGHARGAHEAPVLHPIVSAREARRSEPDTHHPASS